MEELDNQGEQMVEDALKSQSMTLTKKPIKWRTDQPKQPNNPQLAQSMKQQSGSLASVNMKKTTGTP